MDDDLDEVIEEAQVKARKLRDRELFDMKKVLSFPEGRRLMWKILSECGIYRSSFTGTNETFFLEGKRSVGLSLLATLMESSPSSLQQMQREHNSEEKSK